MMCNNKMLIKRENKQELFKVRTYSDQNQQDFKKLYMPIKLEIKENIEETQLTKLINSRDAHEL